MSALLSECSKLPLPPPPSVDIYFIPAPIFFPVSPPVWAPSLLLLHKRSIQLRGLMSSFSGTVCSCAPVTRDRARLPPSQWFKLQQACARLLQSRRCRSGQAHLTKEPLFSRCRRCRRGQGQPGSLESIITSLSGVVLLFARFLLHASFSTFSSILPPLVSTRLSWHFRRSRRLRRHADGPRHQAITSRKAFQFCYLILFIKSGLDFSTVNWPERFLFLLPSSSCDSISEFPWQLFAYPNGFFLIHFFFPLPPILRLQSLCSSEITDEKMETHSCVTFLARTYVRFRTDHLLIEPATAGQQENARASKPRRTAIGDEYL